VLRQFVAHPSFALMDLFLVTISGVIWMLWPEFGVWVILIALLPWVVRLLAGRFPFRRTSFDWLVMLFVATAWIGYWAAYDQVAAWNKVWLIVLAGLLFYALAGQPQENLNWVCLFFFCIGVSVSIYFFSTHDFVSLPRKVEFVNRVGRWIMEIRPKLGWMPIHPNYVAGIAVITTPFILYPAKKWMKNLTGSSTLLYVPILLGLGIALLAVLMATSRGIMMAIASAFGIWILWQIVGLNRSRLQLRHEILFPSLVLICLCAVVLFLYIGPASSGNVLSNYDFGTGSRGELLVRSLYFVLDFPFTGGGLAAFPGLYSYYMLGIPFFNVPNSHNLFLDVAIEQGLLGGLSFLLIFLMSIWFIARAVVKVDMPQARTFCWLMFFALVIAFIHGMVDNYLYNGNGTLLCLALAGLSMPREAETANITHRNNYRILSFVALVLISFFIMNLNRVRSVWHADLGAVQMAKVELAGFPTGQWTEPSILPKLAQAESSLQSALQADPTNQAANHRLGLIAMLRGDFHSATAYLEEANQKAPNHRGIIKSLGYCYVWSGNMEKAKVFLSKIPEARHELDVYVWWWGIHGRPDLSENATMMVSRLVSSSSQ
jgi:hypothetical protein